MLMRIEPSTLLLEDGITSSPYYLYYAKPSLSPSRALILFYFIFSLKGCRPSNNNNNNHVGDPGELCIFLVKKNKK